MATETITRCTICKRTNCDGKEYVAEYGQPYGGRRTSIVVCSSKTHMSDGTRYYHVVFGHGMEEDIAVKEA
jgi:hypothetical protein